MVRLSPKLFIVSAVLITLSLCYYYTTYSLANNASSVGKDVVPESNSKHQPASGESKLKKRHRSFDTCTPIIPVQADVDTVEVFKNFDFQPSWLRSREYWTNQFEERHQKLKMDISRPSLKVILVPHSHNDPGWLMTFEQYFNEKTKQIISNAVNKMDQYSNLTFIWTEISFLSYWWDSAYPSKQRLLKKLVKDGRLEITTGGWVMTDEANSHVFAMVDQLLEGHQWVLANLGVKPKTGWSIDPFGHGSTQPYLLTTSGIEGTILQRLHYAWKQWLGWNQQSDFSWVQNWASGPESKKVSERTSLLTHNQPFDIYSIKHSCGPHTSTCLMFDFRKINGEYSESSLKAEFIDDSNIDSRSGILVEQLAKTGSMFPHNVVLLPIGDDFRYTSALEFDQQYTNYQKIANYVNANSDKFNAELVFGTPKDYFDAIVERSKDFPKLKGDFFVYSDIFSEGRPAYWSGYFTTRPSMKLLDRELESALRSAEILFTVASNRARHAGNQAQHRLLERTYTKLVQARRNLALFQHHDAITGTSKAYVMRDYAQKLYNSLLEAENVQVTAAQTLLQATPGGEAHVWLAKDVEREGYSAEPQKTVLQVKRRRRVVVFNPLAQDQDLAVRLRVKAAELKITGPDGSQVRFQVNPVWRTTENPRRLLAETDVFEIVFVVRMRALALHTYTLEKVNKDQTGGQLAHVFCDNCHKKEMPVVPNGREEQRGRWINSDTPFMPSPFNIRSTQPGDVEITNEELKVVFDSASGFMKSITNLRTRKRTQCAINFSAYTSAQFHSGAYLFMTSPNEDQLEKDVLKLYNHEMDVIITTGSIVSELKVVYGPFLMHTARLYHKPGSSLSKAVQLENVVDFEAPPKNRETDLFMRIISDVQNGDLPEFYTDLNGFQMQRRVKVERIRIEGNYFPVTTMAYIQDKRKRISLLTNHAQGAASWQPGFLEMMLERRTLYDDSRGMGEGVVDNRPFTSTHWLILEDFVEKKLAEEGMRSFNVRPEEGRRENFSKPSLYANSMSNSLNYPVQIFLAEDAEDTPKFQSNVRLFEEEFPCDVHLLNLRTQPDPSFADVPSREAFMILHKQGYDCDLPTLMACKKVDFSKGPLSPLLKVERLRATSLTGLYQEEVLAGLTDLELRPMTLKTLNVTFSK